MGAPDWSAPTAIMPCPLPMDTGPPFILGWAVTPTLNPARMGDRCDHWT